ncbi:MAG: ComEC/Rec2 family competence protein [Ruminococcus sp.]|nr:ComEC/Rec2 family competence protein [Ruminococcus sp.]
MAGLFFASLFSGTYLAAAILTAAVVFLISARRLNADRADYIIAAAVFVFAFGYHAAYTALMYTPAVRYDGTAGSCSGTVTGIREYTGNRAEYTLKGSINGDAKAKFLLRTDVLDVRYGDRVSVGYCTFSKPEDSYLYKTGSRLKSEGVYLVIDRAEDISVTYRGASRLKNYIVAYREDICSGLEREMGFDAGSFLAGMLFGKASGTVDGDTRTVLSRCGIAHILAVSGLHAAIGAAALMWLLKVLGVNRFVSFGLLNVFLLLLLTAADSPVSAVRAAIMADMLCLGRLFRRQADVLTSLSTAVIIICTANPYAVYSAGFLMSAAGTFGIGVFGQYMTKNIPEKGFLPLAAKSFFAVLCAQLCILPLNLKYYGGMPAIAPLANLLLLPLCTVLLVTGYIFVFTGGKLTFLLIPAKYVAEGVLAISRTAAGLDRLYFHAGGKAAVLTAFIAAGVVVLVYIFFRSRKVTAYAAAAACCAVMAASAISGAVRREQFNLAVLGSGGNTAVVLSYHGRSDVFDLSGSYKCPDHVSRYLADNGQTSLRAVFLTRNAPSQYAAYEGALDYISVDSWNSAGDVYVNGSTVSDWGENGFCYDCGDYSVRYDSGVLTVEYGDSRAVFIPSGREYEGEGGLLLYYGRKSTADAEGEGIRIGTDFANDFEITLGKGGSHRIRRL